VDVVPSRRRACRCRVCRARQVKAKHPLEYVRTPKCSGCGRRGTLSIDQHRDSGLERKQHPACRCDGWPFPHRHGSEGCNYYEARPPEVEDFQELYVSGDEPPF